MRCSPGQVAEGDDLAGDLARAVSPGASRVPSKTTIICSPVPPAATNSRVWDLSLGFSDHFPITMTVIEVE